MARRPPRFPWLVAALALAAAPACRRTAPPSDTAPVSAARQWRLLDKGWRFQGSDTLAGAEAPAFDDHAWSTVAVPHTWWLSDPRTYKSAWYRLHFDLPAGDVGLPHDLVFEGVATRARVFLNGTALGEHLGAYTRFAVDATRALRPGDNVLAVQVGNDPDDTADSLPSGQQPRQLYNVFGGVRRKVWLLRTPAVHLDTRDDASSGVYVTPKDVTAASAGLDVRARVRNDTKAPQAVKVRHVLRDPDGHDVLALEAEATVAPGAVQDTSAHGTVDRPRLWGPGHPALYTLATEVIVDGHATDHVDERTGFRDFRMEDGAFLLNGEPILLRGIGKHEESELHASAVTDDEIRADFDLLSDLGVNFVRLAHYPHARLAYDLADERGILVWAENGHSNPDKSEEDGDRITREMVRQNQNHPSVVMWSVGNEAAFYRTKRYAEVVRSADPTRLVVYATNVDPDNKQKKGLDLIARNTYLGWYQRQPWHFEEPGRLWKYISENGAGSVIATHTDYRAARREVDVFEPEEWRQYVGEAYFQMVFRDDAPLLPLYSVWILRDFRVEKYKQRLNTKGLVTTGGLKKDAYYLYRAFLRPDEPLVHITSKTYFLRRGAADNGVKVYSNRRQVRLTVNGVDQGAENNGDYRQREGRTIANVFYWPAPLARGRNEIVADDGEGHQDRAIVYFEGAGGAAPVKGPAPLVGDVRSSNARSPAWYVDAPVQAQWPFYWDLDGTADNTFDVLPKAAEGAGWIATRRLSDPARQTALEFAPTADARVMVMATESSPAPAALAKAGFSDTGETGRWRDDMLQLVPFRLLAKDVRAGETVTIPAIPADYVVLVRRR